MGLSTSAIRVSWVNSNQVPAGHQVYRSDNGGGSFTPRQLLGPGADHWDDSGLEPNTSYQYRVAASNATGESTASAAISGLTLPAAPTGLLVTGISQARVRIQWSDANPTPVQHRV